MKLFFFLQMSLYFKLSARIVIKTLFMFSYGRKEIFTFCTWRLIISQNLDRLPNVKYITNIYKYNNRPLLTGKQ